MSNNLTVSEAQNIQSPPGNSLAIFLDKNGTLQAKDVRGNVYPLSNYLPSGGGGTPTLPDVFLGALTDTTSLNQILNNYNLNVIEGTIPVLFTTGAPSKGAQATSKRYLWKLGAGKFFPIGGSDIESKLELIQEYFLSNNDVEIILSQENAQELPLGVISEDFITYMNTHGSYFFTDVNKTYVVTFTKDDIDYAYIFQGTLGTYGAGNLQFVPDDFIFIYQSTNAGEPTNSTYIRITRSEAIALQATSSFVPGTIYVITDADVNLYGGTEITLTAITSNELSLQGSGKFYCPKYDVSAESTGYGIWTKQMEGTFSNIVGTFVQNEVVTANNGATATYLAEGFLEWISGDWSGATSISGATATADVSGFVSPSYTVGQIVHWGGKSWTNVNGNIGASVDKYTLDAEWTEIPFNEIDYNVYIDEIHYDFGNDMIIYRKDRYNNIVSGSNQVFVEFESPDGKNYGNPIKDFQWGCMQDDFNTNDYFYLGIQGNEVIDSYMETLNSLARYIWFNKLLQKSIIINNILDKTSFIELNTLSSNSSIYNTTLSSSYIEYTTLSNNSRINFSTLTSSSYIQNTTLSNNSYIRNITLTSSSYIQNTTLSSNSYIEYNTLSSYSYIQNNTLSSYSYIQNNTLSNGGSIQKTTLTSYSYIQNTTLSNGGSIQNTTLSSYSRIQTNTLNNGSSIENNTLTSNSSIQNNTLNNGSSIENNTLSSGGQLTFSNEIINKTVSNLEIRNSNVSIPNTATIIFNTVLSKTIFKRLDGIARLQYVNNSDVIVITDVDA